MGRLRDKIAVVTGGGSGIGLATAERFASEGAEVVLVGRNQTNLDAAVQKIDAHASAVKADITSLADLDRLKTIIEARHGRIDVLFANAGGGPLGAFGHVSEADFAATIDINVKGTFFTVQKLLPLLSDGASVVHTTPIMANKGEAGFTVYAAAKAAIRSFARTWTTDLKDRRIRVNAIVPGYIRTEIMMRAGLDQETVDGVYDQISQRTPLGRIGTGDDIAAAALYLASDESCYVTGIELIVDGGLTSV